VDNQEEVMRFRSAAPAASLLIACFILPPASEPAAAATPQSCDVAITKDVTFDRDLDCQNRGPLRIEADGVTVDLAGHTLDSGFSPLIQSLGHNRVTVKNGRLSTQSVAIEMSGRHNLVENVSGVGEIAGAVLFHDGADNRILDSTIDGGAIGPSLVLERERGDALVGNAPATGQILLLATRGSRLSTNDALEGVTLESASRGNRLTANHFQGLFAPGLTVDGSRNRLLDNVVGGTVLEPGAGILVTGRRNLLLGNRVSDSRLDGVSIAAPGNRLGDNVAVNNALLGINAVSGTIDLGGNSASGNGDPRQCVGVACSP
jgi:hypothetical protein